MDVTSAFVKVYHGYGHSGKLVIYGHVFSKAPQNFTDFNNSVFSNIKQLSGLFRVKTIADAALEVEFRGEVYHTRSGYDGFFTLEWEPPGYLPPGLHLVTVRCPDNAGNILHSGEGKVYVPHLTQFGFISDIDDTVMKSYSASIFRRMYELLSRSPMHRKAFADTAKLYRQLEHMATDDDMPNPFFYVSSSEWNLYEYLKTFFRHNKLPEGVFLLNPIKTLRRILKTGKTGHEGKLTRIARVFHAFPKQRFILIGDNTQRDPFIYRAIAEKYPQQVHGVYIRNVRESREKGTRQVLDALQQKGIHVLLFKKAEEAIKAIRRHFGK